MVVIVVVVIAVVSVIVIVAGCSYFLVSRNLVSSQWLVFGSKLAINV